MNVLVTGAAGFIGYHLTKRLLEKDSAVIGLDNFNDYYDPKLKKARHKNLEDYSKRNKKNFEMINGDIKNKTALDNLFKKYKPNIVINLAAQAGVRNSIDNPTEYIMTNLDSMISVHRNCLYI